MVKQIDVVREIEKIITNKDFQDCLNFTYSDDQKKRIQKVLDSVISLGSKERKSLGTFFELTIRTLEDVINQLSKVKLSSEEEKILSKKRRLVTYFKTILNLITNQEI